MTTHSVTLIPGDGTGPEIVETARRVIDATGVSINWEVVEAGADAAARYGTPLPENVLASIRKNRVALKGPLTTPIGTGFRSVNVALRQELDLYVCLRPCKSMKGVRSRYEGIDLTIVRENTEDLYSGIEFAAGSKEAVSLIAGAKGKIAPDAAISLKPISKSRSERIVRWAFEYAVRNHRRKITAVTKANIMKYTDSLFLETAREVARDYQGRIEFEERLIDNMCMQLVQKPEWYDVLVLPNLYGDVVSDLCAGLIGGLGVAPGANFGDRIALFEAVHGSAPKYKGLDKINPTAVIMSGVMMLDHLGEHEAARRLEKAIAEVIAEGRDVTYDLKPRLDDPSAVGTRRMGEAIIQKMRPR